MSNIVASSARHHHHVHDVCVILFLFTVRERRLSSKANDII